MLAEPALPAEPVILMFHVPEAPVPFGCTGEYPRAEHTLAAVKFKQMLPLVVTGEAQTFMFVATIPTEVTVPTHVV